MAAVKTYCKEGSIAVWTKDVDSELPSIPITQASNHGLQNFW